MGETANPNEATEVAAAQAAAAPVARKNVVVLIDHTKDFSTVHGERGPDDPSYGICFIQNGLPFDAEERLIADHPSVIKNPKAKAIIEKMIVRAEKLEAKRAAVAADDEDQIDADPDTEDDGDEAIDLKAWAMGAKQYRWQLVSDAIVLKLQRRVSSKRDALETLIAEGVVQAGKLSPEHRRALARL